MAAQSSIPPAERPFFELIAQTAFANPFSAKRAELHAKTVGHPADVFSDSYVDELTGVITARVQKLETEGKADLRKYPAADRRLMQTVFLFEFYHQYYKDINQLILDQVRLGTQSAPVKFAAEVLSQMRWRGISQPDAVRFFSIFYQLRRAFYFIVRSLIGESACMREFRRHLWQNVFTQEVQRYERYLWNRMEDFSTLL